MKIIKIVLLVTFLLTCNLTLSAAIPPAERQALIDLYNSTNGDSWTKRTGWKTAPLDTNGFAMPGTENTWYGVTLDSGNTSVLKIELHINNLIGTLPASLSNLSNITDLSLFSNKLSGNVPSSLGNLSNLNILRLELNQLSSSIPIELGNLSKLQTLYLSSNKLTGSIPTELGNLNKLTYLDLSGNQLTGSIPSSLSNLSELTSLSLYLNNLTGTIPSDLGNLSKLTSLNLRSNQLSGNIPTELGNLSNLQLLWLYSNNLSGNIPASLGNLNKLTSLSLYSNQLTGSIPSSLGNLSELITLELRINNLTGTIPSDLGNLSKLTSLNLRTNQLSGNIPTELSSLSNLTRLTLTSNQLTGGIPTFIGNLSNLNTLALGGNQLTGSIPSNLGNLSNLVYLSLHSNRLTGSIPSSLGNLSNLQTLYLSSNQLAGSIPTSLTGLTNLVVSSVPEIGADFGYNSLYTSDSTLVTFLNAKDPDWAATQTIAPTGISAVPGGASATISWTPITYKSSTGGYRVFYSTVAGGPYTFYAQTENKSMSSQLITGLTPGIPYYFVVQTRTDAHSQNLNVVDSENSAEALATTPLPAPEINVKQGATNIPTGGTYDFGQKTVGSGTDAVFTIENAGGDTLIITGLPLMTSNPEIVINSQPISPIAPAGSVTFNVHYQACELGPRTAHVSISNNDADENPYIISFTGTGVAVPVPITVASPNGGESWMIGTSRNIAWASTLLSGNVTLDLYKGGVFNSNIGTALATALTFSWTIPANLTAGSDYKVRIYQGGEEDYSNANFSIIPPSPVISSCSPSSGTEGTIISIIGSNFGPAKGIVKINGVSAVIKHWSETEVRAEVPASASSGQIVLTTLAGYTSNGYGFTVETPSVVVVTIDSLPTPIQSGQLFEVKWTISGGTTVTSSMILYNNAGTKKGTLTGGGRAPGAYSQNGIINVTADTTYYFKAQAVVDGKTYYSAEVSRLVMAPILTKPNAPSSVQVISADTTSSKLRLSWSHSNPSNVEGYSLKYKKSSDSIWQSSSCPGSVFAYTFPGLSSDTVYDFQIFAYNSAGSSAAAATSGRTLNNPSPTPTNFHIEGTPSHKIVTLAWGGTLKSGENFHIQRRKNGESVYSDLYSTSNSRVDDKVESSTMYFYKISVLGVYGESGFTSEISATTLAKPVDVIFGSMCNVMQVGCETISDSLIAEKATVIVISLKSVSEEVSVLGKLFVDGVLDRMKLIAVNSSLYSDLVFYPSVEKLTAGTHSFRIEIWNGSQKIRDYSNVINRIFIANGSIRVLIVPINTKSYKHKSTIYFRTDYSDFLKATYPISEKKVSFVMNPGSLDLSYDIYDILGVFHVNQVPAVNDLKKYISKKADNYTWVIGVVPANGIKVAGYTLPGASKFAIVQDDTNLIDFMKSAIAHEIGHLNGLFINEEMYKKSNYPNSYKVGGNCWSGLYNYGKINANRIDLMGDRFDSDSWVIKSTYELLKGKITDSNLFTKAMYASGPYVLLSGWLDREKNVAYDMQAFSNSGDYKPDVSENGEYSIKFLDSYGSSLSDFSFQPSFQAHLGSTDEVDQIPYFFTLVLPDGTKKVEVTHNSVPIGTIYVSPSTPEVTINNPIGGENLSGTNLLSWTGSDSDGDSLKYNLYFSADNGNTWDPLASSLEEPSFMWNSSNFRGTTQGKIKVEASDGFNTTAVVSNGNFAIDRKSPNVGISFPLEGSTLLANTSYQLMANGNDPEDGAIPDAQYFWMSDKDGELGTGPQIDVGCLSEGNHVISVRVTDSEGNTGTQFVNTQVILGYSLNVNATPSSSGTMEVIPQNESYLPNTQVTVTATPETGFQFLGWEGIASAENPLVVTMDSNKTITAKFASTAQIISITSPNGGESWIGGSPHNITWTTTGTVVNVKLEYSTNTGTDWTTIIASTANTNSYAWTVPAVVSANCLIRVSEAAMGSPSDVSNAVFAIVAGVPTIGLSKTSFNFGSERYGTPTPAETSIITNTGTGILNWTAIPSADWISVLPANGTGAGVMTISISRTDMPPGYYTGTIAISSDPNASNSPQTISIGLDVLPVGTDSPPFGNYATPADGETVASSIPVTGWVLDDVGVQSVKIYRGTGLSDRVFIGDAVFSRGSRPDVEVAYPGYPQNERAGWGYMLLTNFLPNGGNGPFTLIAYAIDTGGHEVLLGSKAITCDNLNAVKPFGAIDTPTQGGTASGAAFVNFGWALTPMPKSIPINGSTITVWIDGLPLGHPTYNNPRADIAALFPGYANTNGAVGYYYLNTMGFENRVHTIAWSVGDSAGAADGIGSRYFTIQNVAGGSGVTESLMKNVEGVGTKASPDSPISYQNTGIRSVSEIAAIPEGRQTPIYVKRGYMDDQLAETVFPEADGAIRFEISEVSRVAIYIDEKETRESDESRIARNRRILSGSADSGGASRYEAYELVQGELRPLPIGASFDSREGVLFWQPGPGFLGEYQFVIIDSEAKTRKTVKITIVPGRNSIK